MAVLNAVTVEPNIGVIRNRPFAGFAQERPRSKVWANWSIIIGGEPISLPLGQAIDTMEPASTTGQNLPVVKLNHAKNKALAAFQALGASLKPGETMIVGDASVEGNIVCHLRRINEDLELPKVEGDLDVDGIVALLRPKAEAPKAPADDTKAQMQLQLEALQKALAAQPE